MPIQYFPYRLKYWILSLDKMGRGNASKIGISRFVLRIVGVAVVLLRINSPCQYYIIYKSVKNGSCRLFFMWFFRSYFFHTHIGSFVWANVLTRFCAGTSIAVAPQNHSMIYTAIRNRSFKYLIRKINGNFYICVKTTHRLSTLHISRWISTRVRNKVVF